MLQRFRPIVAMLLVTVILFGVVSSGPVQAASLQEILGVSKTASSGGGIFDLLIGLILGKWLDKVFNFSEDAGGGLFPGSGGSSKQVVGFYAENWAGDTASFESLKRNAASLNTIAAFWGTIHGDGSIEDRGDDRRSVIKYAHDQNTKVLILLNNAKSGASTEPVHRLLSNPASRAAAIANIERLLQDYKLDGVNIDFEGVPPEDRDNLTAFMRELSARLKPKGYLTTISVFPKQNENTTISQAYDYAALAKYADQIMIMTYDNHGKWSGPGPVAGITWVENNLKYALKFIPRQKILMGIAAYGYDWSDAGVTALTHEQAIALANKYRAPIIWDSGGQVPHFTYYDAQGDKHEVWFENGNSLAKKLDLVNQYNIGGIAMWRLGQEAPDYFNVIRDKLR